MATKRIILLVAITALLIAATAVPALAVLSNGQAAPNFQLKDLSGNVHTLNAYRGKVVVIDFFGWACDYCQSDAKSTLVPMFNSYYANDPRVQFLSIEVNSGTLAQDQAFVQETGIPWPVLAGGSGVGSSYQVISTPTLYVISPSGNVALSMEYPTNTQTLTSTIATLEASSTPFASPAICAQSSSRLDLFGNSANSLSWKHSSGTSWSPATSLGGKLTSSPSAASPGNGLIDVFVRGTDNAVWEKTTTNGGSSWNAWTSLGGTLPSGTAPAACAQGSRVDLFVQGTDGALWHKYTTGTSWSRWESLGGKLISSPSAASPGNGLIDVFVRGTDNAVWEKTTTNGGSSWSWTSVGGL